MINKAAGKNRNLILRRITFPSEKNKIEQDVVNKNENDRSDSDV